jgi:hypothetical protein
MINKDLIIRNQRKRVVEEVKRELSSEGKKISSNSIYIDREVEIRMKFFKRIILGD